MTRKIEWNPEHKDADEQEMAWRMEFLSWSFEEKWDYIMALCTKPVFENHKEEISPRKIVWND